MLDFEALKNAQKKVSVRDDSRIEKSNQACIEGFDILAYISRKPHFLMRYLEDATEKFTQALEHSRSNAFAYIGLASIFLCLQSPEKARKYFKIAQAINPALPQIAQFQKMIVQSEIQKNTLKEPAHDSPKRLFEKAI